MRREWTFVAGAAVQIVLFQLLVWALLAGRQTEALWLAGAAVALAGLVALAYWQTVSSKAGR